MSLYRNIGFVVLVLSQLLSSVGYSEVREPAASESAHQVVTPSPPVAQPDEKKEEEPILTSLFGIRSYKLEGDYIADFFDNFRFFPKGRGSHGFC